MSESPTYNEQVENIIGQIRFLIEASNRVMLTGARFPAGAPNYITAAIIEAARGLALLADMESVKVIPADELAAMEEELNAEAPQPSFSESSANSGDRAYDDRIARARPPTPAGWSDTDWIRHLQEHEEPHPLAGQHINMGSMDAAADAYEAEYNEAKGARQAEHDRAASGSANSGDRAYDDAIASASKAS